MPRRSQQPGLDNRHRDVTGEIRRKNDTTKIGTLRRVYGDDFASGNRSDMTLRTLLEESGASSLTDYLKTHHHG